jgi:hypothetical protein
MEFTGDKWAVDLQNNRRNEIRATSSKFSCRCMDEECKWLEFGAGSKV